MSSSSDNVAAVSTAELVSYRRLAAGLNIKPRKGSAAMGGGYRSAFKGRGMEFAEARPYEAGDDVRMIDWRVTARTGKPYTKVFREERERPVLFWVDFRAPMFFATRGVFKSVLAARAASLLVWAAYQHGDRVGGFVVGEQTHFEARPASGLGPVLRFLGQLATHQAWQLGAMQPLQTESAGPAMAGLRRVARPGTLVFVVSDFRGFDDAAEAHLARIAEHSRVVCLFIVDPFEEALPKAGRYPLTDGRRTLSLNAGVADTVERYRQHFEQRWERLRRMSRQHRLSLWRCGTADDVVGLLRRVLHTRGVPL